MPEEFTLSELQKVFETILEETLNMRRSGSRPAQIYTIRDSEGGHFLVATLRGRGVDYMSKS